jgi:SAM-dependent methyltransferase
MDDAIRELRLDPTRRDLVRDSYLGSDVFDSAARFAVSGEFTEVCALEGNRIKGGQVLDLGAGTGISSWAFAHHGASRVYALEPDPSHEVGRGAIARLAAGLPIEILGGIGEEIPLKDACIDLVYTRQVLHHTRDLRLVLKEVARVLKSGGLMLATREHVVDDEEQLRTFLEHHPIHALVGGENAFSLRQYISAIEFAGLTLSKSFGPWDSLINAYPAARNRAELELFPRRLLTERFGRAGAALDRVPGARRVVWARLRRRVPGRLYSFLAIKP